MVGIKISLDIIIYRKIDIKIKLNGGMSLVKFLHHHHLMPLKMAYVFVIVTELGI